MPLTTNIMAVIGIFAAALASSPARAQPARAALVIGNATYSTLPMLPGCRQSANSIAAALRGLGFQVTDRQDPSIGGVDAGIAEFADHLRSAGSVGFIYVCGYAANFNDRILVLPTAASIGRPSDVLTQGTLAKSMLAPVTHDPATIAVAVFDLTPQPGGPAKPGIDALAGLLVPDGVGIVAATETASSDNPTALATTLTAALAGPQVRTDDLLASVQTRLPASVVAIHLPVRAEFLAGGPPPAASHPPAMQSSVRAPVPAGVTPPAAVGSQAKLPDETQMTEADKRQVQSALLRLGYYGSQVDGRFGPETRAAIRRYQHEIGSDTTGYLTAVEATRLVNSH